METTAALPLLAQTLQRLTLDLARYSGLCDRVCTEQLGITGGQGYTLLAIPEGESITMNDLSLKMRLASSTMTRMVDPLVQKGLVDRQPDEQDRRMVRVHMTEQGRQAQQALQETLTAFFAQVLRELPENEREAAVRHLEMLNQAIRGTLQSCCGLSMEP